MLNVVAADVLIGSFPKTLPPGTAAATPYSTISSVARCPWREAELFSMARIA